MKKSKAIIILIICVLALALLAVTGYFAVMHGNNPSVPAKKQSETVSLYFLDSSKTKLVEEKREIEPMPDLELMRHLAELLIEGPKDSVEKKRAIPQETSVLSVSINGSIATVDFSSEFYGQTDADSSLAAATVVKTLCDTDRASKVIILVEGQALLGSGNVALGALGSDDIVYDGSQSANNNIIISLYFADKSGHSLQLETRSVKQNDKEPLEKLAVTELINGPQTDAQRLIPQETKLLSVEVKEGTCFVNLSKDFVDKHQPGSSAETLTIYSIVNTLTEFSNISKVQFLIEGQKAETFGEMVFDEPFTRNNALIKADESLVSQ